MTPQSDTPILRLFRELQSMDANVVEYPDDTEEAREALFQKMATIREKMMEMPSTCAADFAAKTLAETSNGGLFTDWKSGMLWREARELVGMPFLGLAPDDMNEARARLELFEEWTGTTAPEVLLTDDGAATDELLAYCRTNGLSLDWLFLGDEQSLVMMRHYQVKERACA